MQLHHFQTFGGPDASPVEGGGRERTSALRLDATDHLSCKLHFTQTRKGFQFIFAPKRKNFHRNAGLSLIMVFFIFGPQIRR